MACGERGANEDAANQPRGVLVKSGHVLLVVVVLAVVLAALLGQSTTSILDFV
jgi:hypothetical protein